MASRHDSALSAIAEFIASIRAFSSSLMPSAAASAMYSYSSLISSFSSSFTKLSISASVTVSLIKSPSSSVMSSALLTISLYFSKKPSHVYPVSFSFSASVSSSSVPARSMYSSTALFGFLWPSPLNSFCHSFGFESLSSSICSGVRFHRSPVLSTVMLKPFFLSVSVKASQPSQPLPGECLLKLPLPPKPRKPYPVFVQADASPLMMFRWFSSHSSSAFRASL